MSQVLWKGWEVKEAVKGEGNFSWQATGLSIDTRTLCPGDLFIALKGGKGDGHSFLDQAFSQGACAALVEDFSSSSSLPLVTVPSCSQALWDLAEKARQRFQGKILAITGSVGKTTTKEGLFYACSQQAPSFASAASLNNSLGVSLSMARLPQDKKYSIFELGMNHAKEIEFLVRKLQPHTALITNVSYQHGAHFSSLDEIIHAKGEIFSSVLDHQGIIPRHISSYHTLKEIGKEQGIRHWISFGPHPEADVGLKEIETLPHGFLGIRAVIGDQSISYELPSLGYHWVINSLAMISGALALGANIPSFLHSLKTFTPLAGRGQRLSIAGITVIDESYNAAPEAMKAVLTTFADLHHKGPKYILLGEMKELGDQNAFYHEAIIPLINHVGASGVWVCGSSFAPLLDKIDNLKGYGETIQDITPSALQSIKKEAVVLVKGARSMKTFLWIDALYRFYGLEKEAETYPLKPYF